MGRHRQFDERTVLMCAMDVFWKHGFEGTSITEISKATGLQPGSLYGAYGSKRELYLAALRHYLEDVVAGGTARIEANTSGIGGVRDYFGSVAEEIVEGKRRWGCLGTNGFMEMGTRDPDVEQIMGAHFERLRRTFQQALERDGVGDSENDARYLVCVAQGLNVLARTAPDRAALHAILDRAFGSIAPLRGQAS